MPGAHLAQLALETAPEAVEYAPVEHNTHCSPAIELYFPEPHCKQTEAVTAPSWVEYLPVEHGVHAEL